MAQTSVHPKSVQIIRHGEKPSNPSDPELSARGKERALALARDRVRLFGSLDYLFAASNSTESLRCVATITPLAQVIHREIDSSIAAKDYSELVQQVLQQGDYKGKRVLVCWHHEEIHDLANGLGAVGVPQHWPGSVFDRIWRLEFNGHDHPTFENSPQNLLPGDTAS